MGRIKRFNLKRLQQFNNASNFFETGTWKGDGLAYAAKYPFAKLYSSEIIPSIAERAKDRFKSNKRIEIITASSIDALESTINILQGNCIFWLDAHFPGAEEGLKDYNEEKDHDLKLPLEREMQIIQSRASRFSDVILVDDLRIYEENNYDSGNLPEGVLPPSVRNIDFADKLFGSTHEITRSTRDEGYLILLPKKAINKESLQGTMYSLENKLGKKII